MLKKFISKLQIIFIPCETNDYRPKFLQGNFLPYSLIFLFVLKFAIIPFLIYLPSANLFADVSKAVLIELTNRQRVQLGLSPLKENPRLNQAALLKAQDILEKDYFNHWSPQGVSPWYWIEKANYNYQTAGENLGIGFLDSNEVHQAWEDSPSHKANLLNPKYREIGIAVLTGDFQGNETTIVVQLFGTPKEKVKIQKSPKDRALNALSARPTGQAKVKITNQNARVEEDNILTKENALLSTTVETVATASAQKIAGTEIKTEEFTEVESVKTENKKADDENKGFIFGITKFISYDYFSLVQDIAFYLLFLILFGLLLNIFIYIKIQHKDLIFKTIFCIFLLIIFVFLDKNLIIQLIPHKLEIMSALQA